MSVELVVSGFSENPDLLVGKIPAGYDEFQKKGQFIKSTNNPSKIDDQDRLLTYNTRTYSYNANGDLAQIQWTPTTQSTYTYDAIGNLKQANLVTGNALAYSYDGLNRRTLKNDGTTLKYRYLYEDNYRVSAQVNNSGQILKTYMYATSPYVADYMTVSGVTYRLIKDHLGSPRLVVNVSDGTVIQRMDYNDLGEAVTDTNGGYQPFGFAGGLYDAQTKLIKFGARDYDPRSAGRWTSKDPLLFGGGSPNLYEYVWQDPINVTDPSGLQPPGNVFADPGYGGEWVEYSSSAGSKVKPELESSASCLAQCLATPLTITAGMESTGHTGEKDPHTTGDACDFGYNSNPGLSTNPNLQKCYNQCYDKSNLGLIEKTNLHTQDRPGPGNYTGLHPYP